MSSGNIPSGAGISSNTESLSDVRTEVVSIKWEKNEVSVGTEVSNESEKDEVSVGTDVSNESEEDEVSLQSEVKVVSNESQKDNVDENPCKDLNNYEPTVPEGTSKEKGISEIENQKSECEDQELPELINDFVDISPNKDGGVNKRIMVEGRGSETPGCGDRVTIYFNAWVLNPQNLTKFDTNVESDPSTFSLGRGFTIKGCDIGISTMKTGEVALFLCQPSYAFGAAGKPPMVPPVSPVLYEITLVSWCYEDLSHKKDKGIRRKSMVKGEGPFPNEGALIKVHITGHYENQNFEDRDLEFNIGEGCILNIPEGIEIGLLKFRKGEISRLFLSSAYAFGSEGKPEYNIPPNANVEYDVTLLDFQKVKEVWEMNTDDKWTYSVEAKEKGTHFFKDGELKAALKQFKRIVKYLEKEPGVSPEEVDRRQQLLLSGYLNVALCNLKLDSPMEAVKICEKALEIDAKNEKALFRKGQGLCAVNDFVEALEDFKKVVLYYPTNKAAQKYVITCQNGIEHQKRKERRTYGNMFKRFAEEDEELRKQQQYQTETGVWGGQEHPSSYLRSIADEDAIVKMLNKQNLCMTERDA